jgi:PAS domain S-box-containing protein
MTVVGRELDPLILAHVHPERWHVTVERPQDGKRFRGGKRRAYCSAKSAAQDARAPVTVAFGNDLRHDGAVFESEKNTCLCVAAEGTMDSSRGMDELHYREIVQSSPDLILVGRRGFVTYINDAGVRLLRANTADEILGRVALDFFDPAYHQQILARTARLLEAPAAAPLVEEKLRALDGTPIDVEVRAASFLSDGEIAIQIVCRDIVERKMALRFRQLAEAMPQIVWTAEPDGALDYASQAFADYTGDGGDKLPVQRWLDTVHLDDKKAVLIAWDKALRSGAPYAMEFRIRRRDGAYRWHFATAVPVREDGRIVKWFGSAIDVHDRKLAEQKIYELAARQTTILESITDAFYTVDNDWRVTYVNSEMERVVRMRRDELIGKGLWDSFPAGVGTPFEREMRRAMTEKRPLSIQGYVTTMKMWVDIRVYPSPDGLSVYFRDVTEQRELENRLRQSQRLEAVGQLTGGVAHDFNNLLTVIMGNAETLVASLDHDPKLRALAELTALAAERGAELTQRLLAFARKQTLTPKAIDVDELLAGMNDLLARALGEQVEIELVRASGLWHPFVDAAQLESAILNLCINARDAMPGGGRLTIETANVTLDETYARNADEVTAGQYVMIAVSDTGTGMPPEVAARAFEPFFTTKEVGKGTGLGLSMVHGFVKQSRGHVKIYSEAGQGTTVKLYLPKASDSDETATPSQATLQRVEGGSERILLVEDDAQVREHVAGQLRDLGYEVVAVAAAAAALAALEQRTFDLLFTDIVMPGGMNGRQLADQAHERWPHLRVLYSSGYTDNAIVHHGRLDQGVHLLSKPYRRSELAAKLRQVLKK